MDVYVLYLQLEDWWTELLIFTDQASCFEVKEDIIYSLLPSDYLMGIWYYLWCLPQTMV